MSHSAARKSDASEPGIILLQIDGLAYVQFRQALTEGRMPFLQSLIEKRNYRLEAFYSGLPSTTPAVQAELFFGIPAAVPAIRFLSRSSGEDCLMLNPRRVKEFAERLSRRQNGLLHNGSSYSNIYTGGALSARYCIETLEPQNLLKRMRPLRTLWTLFQHLGKIARIFGLALVESGLALADLLQGIRQKEPVFKEIKFVPTRIWICVVLREFIRFWVKLDIRNGVPIICANFVGYDEHAHRRGPDSAFAHWSLTGIDGVLRDIWHKARKSKRRQYQVLIYSDHGQEAVIPYLTACKRSLSAGLRSAFMAGPLAGLEISWTEELIGQFYFFKRGRKLLNTLQQSDRESPAGPGRVVVTALGPLGHIYLPHALAADEMAAYAQQLVSVGDIPLVLYRPPGKEVRAINRHGAWQLPEHAVRILGAGHPCPEEAGSDLIRLVDHQDAGDFVISGWTPDAAPLTFPMENGAHGGPGSRECHGFLLLPEALAGTHQGWWRPSVLRKVVLGCLGRRGDEHV